MFLLHNMFRRTLPGVLIEAKRAGERQQKKNAFSSKGLCLYLLALAHLLAIFKYYFRPPSLTLYLSLFHCFFFLFICIASVLLTF